MATIKRFEDIEAWQLGRELKRALYTISKRGEFGRDFPFRDQVRRAAMSVTANIAEGFERDGNREFAQFLSNSKRSCGEIQDHLYTALDERYLPEAEFKQLYEQAGLVARKIGAFMSYLRTTEYRGRKFPDATERNNSKPQTRNSKLSQ